MALFEVGLELADTFRQLLKMHYTKSETNPRRSLLICN